MSGPHKHTLDVAYKGDPTQTRHMGLQLPGASSQTLPPFLDCAARFI